MSVLAELDRIRDGLSAPGQQFELIDQTINGAPLKTYRNLPRNLTYLILEAGGHAERTFIVSGERRLKYSEALSRASGLSERLKSDYGVGAGTQIAIAMRNSPEWILAFIAILLAGGTAVLVNSRGAPDKIIHGLHDTECMLVIADRRRAEAIADGFRGPIIIADDAGNFRDPLDEIIEIAPAPVRVSDATPEDPAIIMFTSGTTGRPKGAVLTHRGVSTFLFGMRHNGATYLTHAARRMSLEPAALAAAFPQMATLAIFPLFHVSGASAMLLGAIINGGKIVIMDRWDPEVALSLIARERITSLQGPPSIFWDVLGSLAFESADLSSITNIGIGGQATPPNLLAAISKAFPKAAPGGGFGMTETNGAIASGTGEEYLSNPKAGGRLLPGVEVRITDDEGHDLPLGAVGEIWVRGALVMAGYWNQPEANAAVFRDGWLRTGDIGYLDSNRFITIVDRKKDVIIRGGENIYCAELERVFQEFPGVMEVAAFGTADDHWGERVVLAIVPHTHADLDKAAILAFGRDRLASYKLPSEITVQKAPFVRNAVGKIDKAALRRAYSASKS